MLQAGLTASVDHTVTGADTAAALGSGDVPVLATPRVIALCEAATVAAIAGHLDAGRTTVGIRVEIDHVAPSAVDARITATATLDRTDRHLLVFSVVAAEGSRTVAEGVIHRRVVDRQRFLDRT